MTVLYLTIMTYLCVVSVTISVSYTIHERSIRFVVQGPFVAAGDIRRRLSESLSAPQALFKRDPEDPSGTVQDYDLSGSKQLSYVFFGYLNHTLENYNSVSITPYSAMLL